MLTLILAESSLETIPTRINKKGTAKIPNKKGKKRDQTILDIALHRQIIQKLPNPEKRGRPDITHLSLLAALGTPLNKQGQLRTYVHTIQDKIIKIDSKTRLPKNYNRFIGLMQQLYKLGKVPPEGPPLLTLEKMNLETLIRNLKPSETILFTEQGTPSKPKPIMNELAKQEKPVVIIGGFPHGEFSTNTLKLADKKISIYPEPLDTWIVVSRVLYCYEAIVLEKNKHK
ncbi:MAG: 16S rRNA methyltransferase [Candidatus Jordarchaeum sp.]|uniref:16S rRNA methyltransferase n=1 Tax=Candidatus Jordarchaeum sp. TaxID=2823881 RepID=UPI004049C29D